MSEPQASGTAHDEVRREIREWLHETLPADWPHCGHGAWVAQWQMRFFTDRWATPTWPEHLGGRGLDDEAGRIVYAELSAVDAPVPANFVTVGMLGATLMEHGTPEQQARLLPDLAGRRAIWCQLFSEPGAGSDLASLSTRAVRDGDRWSVTGQKVWSSYAAEAKYGLLLARTDPSLAKQQGITAFALPLDTPGVTVVGLRQMTGESIFCEVFLDEAWIDDDLRIGAVNDGWRVAGSMLGAERKLLGGGGGSPVQRVGGIDVEELIRVATGVGPVDRDRLMQAWVRDTVVGLLGQRMRTNATAAPLVKIAQTKHNQALQELAVDLVGPSAIANDGTGIGATVGFGLLRSRANTIGGGTTEIMKTLVGERMLGLPREPDPYRGKPWSEIPRS